MQCRDASDEDKALITQYIERGIFKRVSGGRASNSGGGRAGNSSGGGGGGGRAAQPRKQRGTANAEVADKEDDEGEEEEEDSRIQNLPSHRELLEAGGYLNANVHFPEDNESDDGCESRGSEREWGGDDVA